MGSGARRSPDGQAVLKTATLDDVQQFDAVFTVAQVRIAPGPAVFAPPRGDRPPGRVRPVPGLGFRAGRSSLHTALKDSAWPVKEVL